MHVDLFDIEQERSHLNREAARLLCRLDEIKKRLRELWKEQSRLNAEGSNARTAA
jgi:predicted nuclease with TOPRIM domain